MAGSGWWSYGRTSNPLSSFERNCKMGTSFSEGMTRAMTLAARATMFRSRGRTVTLMRPSTLWHSALFRSCQIADRGKYNKYTDVSHTAAATHAIVSPHVPYKSTAKHLRTTKYVPAVR